MTPADLAREGDLDTLYALADRDAYKWLCAAVDFGHDAAAHIDDL
jgi:hypothetical protein